MLPTKFLPAVKHSAIRNNEAAIKKIVDGLTGVYVRTFEFAKPGEFTEADLEPLRSKLQAPAWSKVVDVSSKRENVGVYLMSSGKEARLAE
ncbi:MAG: DUF4252 domain-containing protein [Bryobacteraceae bacterium]